MKHKLLNKNWQLKLPVFTAWCLLVTYLMVVPVPVTAQLPVDKLNAEPAESSWQAPDLTALPSNWLSQLKADSTELTNQRVSLFLAALEQRTKGLEGDELITAQNGIANLKSQFDLLALARLGPLDHLFDPPLAKESYFLDDVLSLRAQWRELAAGTAQVNLQIEQTVRQTSLLRERRDKLLRQYGAVDPKSPSKILIGINRITARVEYELALASAKNFRQI